MRLFENKDKYNLTCNEVADLLNLYAEYPKGESTYRKDYAAFNRGRMYERSKNEDGVSTRILSASDFHIPFQKPISVFNEYAGKVDILQINGDLLDCSQLSKFIKTYRSSVMEELITARQYLIDLIELLSPKKVVVNYGNHELRLGSYLAKTLDCDVQELMPQTAFDYLFVDGFTHYNRKSRTKTKYEPLNKVFDDIEIDFTGTWFSQIGNVIFCHPRAFSSGIMKTAEKALYWFRNEGYSFSSIVMSHTHRLGQYKIGNTMAYEQGTCCKTKDMLYSDGLLTNSQVEGFLYLCLDKNGDAIRDKSKLVEI